MLNVHGHFTPKRPFPALQPTGRAARSARRVELTYNCDWDVL